MVLEFIPILLVQSVKDIGKMIYKMESVLSIGKMVLYTKEVLKKEKK